MDYVVTNLYGRLLDHSLGRIRTRLSTAEKQNIEDAVQSFSDDVSAMLQGEDAIELVDAARAATTEAKLALDRVTSWFYRTDDIVDEPFSIADAVDISAETVSAVTPAFRVDGPGASADEILLQGYLLNALVDVFCIVFGNVVRHSGMPIPMATVAVSLAARELLSIEVTNAVDASQLTEANADKVYRIKQDMESPEHIKFISREGGSGLHKLKKVLQHDVDANAVVEFGFTADGRFRVQFETRVARDENSGR